MGPLLIAGRIPRRRSPRGSTMSDPDHYSDHRKTCARCVGGPSPIDRSEEHTSELPSPMRISYAVFCLKKKTNQVAARRNSKRHIETTNTYTQLDMKSCEINKNTTTL